MAEETLDLIIRANIEDLLQEMYEYVSAAKDAEDQIRRFEIAIKKVSEQGSLAFEQVAEEFANLYKEILKTTSGAENIFAGKSLRNLNKAVDNLRKAQTSVLTLDKALRGDAQRFYELGVAAKSSREKVDLIAQAIKRISEVAGISIEAAKREFVSFAQTLDREAARAGG
ncbi:hypothetical protein D6833_10245, partial [Candidatus Parcubacteria bacterium]